MNEDVRRVINALPLNLREETRVYAKWLEDNVGKWIRKLPRRYEGRVQPDEFVTVAICKRVLDLPSNQLRTIKSILRHIESRGTRSIQLPRELLEADSRAVRELETLRSQLEKVLRESDLAYVMEARRPRELFDLMAEGPGASK
jgi:hypothetical protein